MADDRARKFHAESVATARRDILNRISYGTKGSTPATISKHRLHPDFKGIPTTNPSGASPFFVNRAMPGFSAGAGYMTGGVLKDFRYAQSILKRRARDTTNIDLAKEGQPPLESPLLQLSEVESRSLELNNLLQQTQDAVEAGDVTAQTASDLKNILRLYVALLPTFTGANLAEFDRFFEEIVLTQTEKQDADRASAADKAVREFFIKLMEVNKGAARVVERSVPEKVAAAKALLARIFKTGYGKLGAAADVRAVEGDLLGLDAGPAAAAADPFEGLEMGPAAAAEAKEGDEEEAEAGVGAVAPMAPAGAAAAAEAPDAAFIARAVRNANDWSASVPGARLIEVTIPLENYFVGRANAARAANDMDDLVRLHAAIAQRAGAPSADITKLRSSVVSRFRDAPTVWKIVTLQRLGAFGPGGVPLDIIRPLVNFR